MVNMTPITNFIKQLRIKGLGHVVRRGEGDIVRAEL